MNERKLQVLEENTLSEQMAGVFKSKRDKFGKGNIDFHVMEFSGACIENFIRPFFLDNCLGNKIDSMLKWAKSARLLANHCLVRHLAIEGVPRKRFQVLAQGGLSDQMTRIMKNGGMREDEKGDHPTSLSPSPTPAIPQIFGRSEEESSVTEKNRDREAWEYEIAMGWQHLINTFFSHNNNKAAQEYSIPAFFPTHQWIENTLTDQQWMEKSADGTWTKMPVATRPISWI